MNKPELKESILKASEQKHELNCFLTGLCYIGEFLLYPPIMLIYYLLVLIFANVMGIVLGALMCVLIGFFPFFLLCCFCEKGRPIGSMLCGLSVVGVLLVVCSSLYLAFSPIIAIAFFFWTYVLIFTGKVSPHNSFAENWSTMTSYLAKNKDYLYKMYEEKKGGFNKNSI
jgi:hypothetical protein